MSSKVSKNFYFDCSLFFHLPLKNRFVTKIEGNAVEEGARVFFEGIVDSQPQPIFTWYFDDEEIFPGDPGFEDAEIHHSRKMSTLILKYAREHHMGKYTLVAQNRLGHDISNCDLIVRKKQYPPVFWQRLVNTEAFSGARIVAEVEVGGWPLPEITWYKDGELVTTCIHTENYNGFPNKYVPERRIEVRQIDQIRYCIIFHRISESDSGVYTCRAVNGLGEAVCEAEFLVEAGEGGTAELYLPELWKTGKRLTWKDEDRRPKKFVGVSEPELTDEDIAGMTKRVASTPLPRAMEYFANMPDYKPKPLSSYGFVPMDYSPKSALKGIQSPKGQQGGKPSWPSRFVKGDFDHRDYNFDDWEGIQPIWLNPRDPNAVDPWSLRFQPVLPGDYPPPMPRAEREKSPDAPPVWESDADIAALYQMLAAMGMRTAGKSATAADIRSDKIGNASQARRQQQQSHQRQKQEHAQARKQVLQNTKKSPRRGENAVRKKWEEKLNADIAGAQNNAAEFTSQFTSSHQETNMVQVETPPTPPPALPPKTKIMFSPSRNVFSPTQDDEQNKEYIPVKEKAKMITEQQQMLMHREFEEQQEHRSSPRVTGDTLKGGVCILPPSPVTVRKEMTTSTSASASSSSVHFSSSQTFESSSSGMVTSSTSSSSRTMSASHVSSNMIPVLEDKYNVGDNLDELAEGESTTSKSKSAAVVTFAEETIINGEKQSRATFDEADATAEDEFESLVKQEEEEEALKRQQIMQQEQLEAMRRQEEEAQERLEMQRQHVSDIFYFLFNVFCTLCVYLQEERLRLEQEQIELERREHELRLRIEEEKRRMQQVQMMEEHEVDRVIKMGPTSVQREVSGCVASKRSNVANDSYFSWRIKILRRSGRSGKCDTRVSRPRRSRTNLSRTGRRRPRPSSRTFTRRPWRTRTASRTRRSVCRAKSRGK